MPAVSNTSPLILYGRIGRLELLREVFDEVFVPRVVIEEVRARGSDSAEVSAILGQSWIVPLDVDEEDIQDTLRPLDRGEAHALTLANRFPFDQPVLIDDRRARIVAQRAGFIVIGSGGILVLAKRKSLIPYVRPLLDELRVAGLYLSDRVYSEIVERAGESSVSRNR